MCTILFTRNVLMINIHNIPTYIHVLKSVSLVVVLYCIDSDLVGLEMMLDNGEDYLSLELEKHKKRLKEITTALEMQHQLLRLIVQVIFVILHFYYFTNILCNFF